MYPDNVNRASDYACIVFIFIYALGYSVGFGPAAWVYGAEVLPSPFSSPPTPIFVSDDSKKQNERKKKKKKRKPQAHVTT